MPPAEFSLRSCEFRDLGQVAQVERASFPELPYSRLDFAYYLAVTRSGFIVASSGDRVVGYVIAIKDGREGVIQSIGVLPEFRRRGAGEALMRSAIDRLSGKVEKVRLLVAVDNPGAIDLYRKLSFEETGKTVRGYYPDGSDAVEMVKRL